MGIVVGLVLAVLVAGIPVGVEATDVDTWGYYQPYWVPERYC